MTSNTQEISNAVFNLKEKMTDSEFKNIMDLLKIKNDEEKKDEKHWYNYSYFKQSNKLAHNGTEIVRRFLIKRKTKRVYIKNEKTTSSYSMDILTRVGLFQKHIEKLGKCNTNHEYGSKLFKDDNGDWCLDLECQYTSRCNVWFNNPYRAVNNDSDCDTDNEDEEDLKKQLQDAYGVWVEYLEKIPISLTKIE